MRQHILLHVRTLFSFASSVRGVREKRARHMASSNVDFPAPVGPDIAKIPAEAKGSSVKSMENSPSSDARLRPLIASTLIKKPPSSPH